MIVAQSERIRYDTNVINTMRKGEFAMRAQNLTLLTDLYELTMMQGYYENPSDQIVVFDAFYRKNPSSMSAIFTFHRMTSTISVPSIFSTMISWSI